MEIWDPLAYAILVPETLEQRAEYLEKEFAELRSQVLGLKNDKRDWRSAFGMLEDDKMTREAARLGREYREAQTWQKEFAGS